MNDKNRTINQWDFVNILHTNNIKQHPVRSKKPSMYKLSQIIMQGKMSKYYLINVKPICTLYRIHNS